MKYYNNKPYAGISKQHRLKNGHTKLGRRMDMRDDKIEADNSMNKMYENRNV